MLYATTVLINSLMTVIGSANSSGFPEKTVLVINSLKEECTVNISAAIRKFNE